MQDWYGPSWVAAWLTTGALQPLPYEYTVNQPQTSAPVVRSRAHQPRFAELLEDLEAALVADIQQVHENSLTTTFSRSGILATVDALLDAFNRIMLIPEMADLDMCASGRMTARIESMAAVIKRPQVTDAVSEWLQDFPDKRDWSCGLSTAEAAKVFASVPAADLWSAPPWDTYHALHAAMESLSASSIYLLANEFILPDTAQTAIDLDGLWGLQFAVHSALYCRQSLDPVLSHGDWAKSGEYIRTIALCYRWLMYGPEMRECVYHMRRIIQQLPACSDLLRTRLRLELDPAVRHKLQVAPGRTGGKSPRKKKRKKPVSTRVASAKRASPSPTRRSSPRRAAGLGSKADEATEPVAPDPVVDLAEGRTPFFDVGAVRRDFDDLAHAALGRAETVPARTEAEPAASKKVPAEDLDALPTSEELVESTPIWGLPSISSTFKTAQQRQGLWAALSHTWIRRHGTSRERDSSHV